MNRFKRNDFAQTDMTACDTGNGFFSGVRCGNDMRAHVPHKIETNFYGSIDLCFDYDNCHKTPPLIGKSDAQLSERH
jgi:hypothetical protein